MTGETAGRVPVPVLIDCDPGVDDTLALLLACASPELSLRGVTTVAGNVDLARTTRNALRVLTLARRTDVPVAAGAERPLVRAQPTRAAHAHGDDGVRGAALPEPAVPVDRRHAVDLLAESIAASAEPLTLIAIGPLTNVALLCAVHPGLAARLDRLVVMGGSSGSGNITPAAEFNVWSDPEAAYRVLTEPGLPRPVRTTMVGLDVTLAVPVRPPDVRMLAAGGAAGRAVAAVLDSALDDQRRETGEAAIAMHDAVAVAEVIRPGLLRTEPCTITVDYSDGPGRGATVVDRRAAQTWLRFATAADAPAVVELVVRRVAAYSPSPAEPFG